MKSMMIISKSLLLFTKVVMVMSTWRNTKCEQQIPTSVGWHLLEVKFSASLVKISCFYSTTGQCTAPVMPRLGVRISLRAPLYCRLTQRLECATYNRVTKVRLFRRQPNADLAQLVVQLTCNQQVTGSIPVVGTILFWVDMQTG